MLTTFLETAMDKSQQKKNKAQSFVKLQVIEMW